MTAYAYLVPVDEFKARLRAAGQNELVDGSIWPFENVWVHEQDLAAIGWTKDAPAVAYTTKGREKARPATEPGETRIVGMPARVRRMQLVRDQQGRVVETVQTEQDVL